MFRMGAVVDWELLLTGRAKREKALARIGGSEVASAEPRERRKRQGASIFLRNEDGSIYCVAGPASLDKLSHRVQDDSRLLGCKKDY